MGKSEDQAVRATASVCLLAACIGLAGCKSFGFKSKDRGNAPSQQPADLNGQSAAAPPARGSTDRRTTSDLNGVLAGRVLDSYENRPPPTFIKVVLASNNKENRAAPIEMPDVKVDDQGYFTIYGLQQGQHYELIARTRDGERKLAGRGMAIPPNTRVLIHMSEDFATENVPPAPGATIPGKKDRSENSSQETPKPTNSIPPQRPVDIGRPIKVNEGGGNSASTPSPEQLAPRDGVRPEDIARERGGLAAAPPVANIPGSRENLSSAQNGSSLAIPPITSRVPSCVLTGRQLDNFALYDLNGRPWEYRYHRGRIVLLDFWGTWCPHCLGAMRSLKILHEKYSGYGLEIVGIAYEEGPLPEQVRKVQNVRGTLGIDYRLLLGSDITTCPVKTQFSVNNFPALVLIDDNNRIIWRNEGLDTYKLQELEMLIKQQLHLR
jgi:thiol-disulfide isomerase/thioredoxin